MKVDEENREALLNPPAGLERVLPLVNEIISAIARRRGLLGDEADELQSRAYARIVRDDYQILRAYRAESTWRTYLTRVLNNLYHDVWTRRNGRWRSSKLAQRKGAIAVALETMIYRDGWPVSEAVEHVRTRHRDAPPPSELFRLAAELPLRMPLESVPVDGVVIPDPGHPESQYWRRELDQRIESARVALNEALAALPAKDEMLVRMHFFEGLSVAHVARKTNMPQKPLYRRVGRTLKTLKMELERRGVGESVVQDLLMES